jgi:hypothetical protein
MIGDDYKEFEALKRTGVGPEAACREALSDSSLSQADRFSFSIRMLRSVFGLSLGAARDVAATIVLEQRSSPE